MVERSGRERQRQYQEKNKPDCPPAPVHLAPPERELERKLKRNPDDLDAKADVGSDESMDASIPRRLSARDFGRNLHRPRNSPRMTANNSYGYVTKTLERCNKPTIHSFTTASEFLALLQGLPSDSM